MTKTHTEYLVVGVWALMLLVLAGVFAYLHSRIAAMELELTVDRSQLAKLQALEETQEERALLLRRTETGRAELEQYLLPVDDPSPVIGLIEEMAMDTGVTVDFHDLQADTVSGPVTGDDAQVAAYPSMRVVLSVAGSWSSVYTFLRALEYVPFAARIDSTTFEYADGDENGWYWKGQVQMHVGVM